MLTGMPAYGSTPTERRTMSRALAFLLTSGAALLAVCLVLPFDGDAHEPVVLATVGVALAVAAALLRYGRHVSTHQQQATVLLGTTLVGVVIVAGGPLGQTYPLVYVWVSLFAFFFFTTRAAVAQVAWVAVSSAAALTWQHGADVDAAMWVMTIGSITVAGVLVERLTSAVRAQASDLAVVSRMTAGLSDVGASAQSACDGICGAVSAEVAIYLEPLPGGEGLQVTAMHGQAEAGMVFAEDGPRLALERAFHTARAVDLPAVDGRVHGVAQPVVRDGRSAAVLAVAWTQPRRRVNDRVRNTAVLFAAQAGVAMDRAEERRRDIERQALEINDNIVQGLVVAKYCAQRGDVDRALEAIDETLERARKLITAQLEEVSRKTGGLQPGDLARATASTVAQSPPRPSGG